MGRRKASMGVLCPVMVWTAASTFPGYMQLLHASHLTVILEDNSGNDYYSG